MLRSIRPKRATPQFSSQGRWPEYLLEGADRLPPCVENKEGTEVRLVQKLSVVGEDLAGGSNRPTRHPRAGVSVVGVAAHHPGLERRHRIHDPEEQIPQRVSQGPLRVDL